MTGQWILPMFDLDTTSKGNRKFWTIRDEPGRQQVQLVEVMRIFYSVIEYVVLAVFESKKFYSPK